LDLYDSGLRKGYEIVMVATTNHITDIQKGMMRSGRIDSVIQVGPMDRAGVERLCHIVIGDSLAADIDYDAVYAATEGYMPAFVKEGIERSLRFVIADTGDVGLITGDALVKGLKSLRRQHELFEGATDRKKEMPALDQMFREAMREQVQSVVEETNWVDHAESAINNYDLPSAERVGEIVDHQIEYRINGANVVSVKSGETVSEITTN
jgi:SpoVK/Ycf46/Vps4 family AAA+-type ATPase